MTHFSLIIQFQFLKQFEIAFLSQNIFLFVLILLSLIVFMFLWFRIELRKQRSEIEKDFYDKNQELIYQKEKAEKLLANLLPKQTAEELQTKGKVSSRRFRMVTVLFSDIHGFTKLWNK